MLIPPPRFANQVKLFKSTPRGARDRIRLKTGYTRNAHIIRPSRHCLARATGD
jgi:hypothetical protein